LYGVHRMRDEYKAEDGEPVMLDAGDSAKPPWTNDDPAISDERSFQRRSLPVRRRLGELNRYSAMSAGRERS